MGLFGDDYGIDLNGHLLTIRNAIVGYKKSEHYPSPLVLVLPRLDFDKKSDDKDNVFEEAGMALYPKSEYFNYDKGAYLASLISLNNEISGTLVFIHAERIDNSECRDDWENLLKNLMTHSPIRISDELTITRPETDFTVIVCTEKPHFLKEGTSKDYHCIDLSDNNPKREADEKKYNDYAANGGDEMKKNKKSSEPAGSIATEKSAGKHIDWEERRFEILKALVAGNRTLNLVNSEAITKLLSASGKIVEHYRKCIVKQ